METKISIFFKKIDSGKIFFFAGSGISLESNLPGVQDILYRSAKTFLPKNLPEDELNYICRNIQPEIFYEMILRLAKTNECLNIWRGFHRDTQSQFNVKCIPNYVHRFIVEHSFRHFRPIITTNFDTMFEKAADLLDIPFKVRMPYDDPPSDLEPELNICKLHGSIENESGKYTPQSLKTTMTDITKVNTGWIKYLLNLISKYNICFVGYSGRDIDIFPFIKQYVMSEKTQQPVWINNFSECKYSDSSSREIAAIRISEYPNVVLPQYCGIFKNGEKNHENLEDCETTVGYTDMLNSLENELSEKKILEDASKKLLYVLTVAQLGEYSKAYTLAKQLYINCFSEINFEHSLYLLHALSGLSHESAKYYRSRFYARKILSLKRKSDKVFDYKIVARYLVSESYRMSLPFDAYFKFPEGMRWYGSKLFVFSHFINSYILNRAKLILNNRKLSICDPVCQHEHIEHTIRFFSIIQTSLGDIHTKWNSFSKKILKILWKNIYDKSYKIGYFSGIANAGKYKYRIEPERNTGDESKRIYDLAKSSTGNELLIRNEAEELLRNNNLIESKKKFWSCYIMSRKSGNKLNQIKALLGVSYINTLENKRIVLPIWYQKNLFKMMDEVEGKKWQIYFNFIKKKIQSE